MHQWLLGHRHFGALLRNWENHRVIPRRAKILATAMIVPLTGYMLLAADTPLWADAAAVLLVLWGLVFIWTKSSAC